MRNLTEQLIFASFPQIWNADQMGLQLEVTSGRTLTIRGMKKVACTVQRMNATTHSYTVQITLNASGFLPEKLPVILHETTGLPKNFDQIRANFGNIHVYSSRSGMMGKELAKLWMLEDFLPIVQQNSLLIIDSWTGYKEMTNLPEIAAKELRIEILPGGTTPILQPADVYFNRTFKHFIRRVSNKIRWRHKEFILSVRANLLTVLDLTYNQFKAPMYNPFLQYSWYKAGYFSEHPPEFSTPTEFCLNCKNYNRCERDDCNQSFCFMRCSYCKLHLCFTHIIDHRH